ncbi:MAG: UPF0175 family protein [Acidobacteriota bacterium]
MHQQLTIEYRDEILLSLGLEPDEFALEARFLLAAKLYELGRLSSGQAARLSAMRRAEFLLSLPRIGVTVSNLRAEDAQAEIAFGLDD